MCESRNSSTNLVVGVAIGAAISAGLTFLFATKKGKELRDKVRNDYPEVFDRAEEVITNAKDSLSEDYANVIDEVTKVKEEISKMTIGEATEATKDAVTKKVNDLDKAVKSLGKSPHFFRGVKRKK